MEHTCSRCGKLYCERCHDFTFAAKGAFIHPDLGRCSCMRCFMCGEMVFLR